MKKIFITIILVLAAIGAHEAGAQQDAFPIDITWKANTYTPPGFGTKALPVPGSRITVAAFTPTQNPASLDFTWVVEDSSFTGLGPLLSGQGETVFQFTAEQNLPHFEHRIKLIVTNPVTDASVTRRITIPLQAPRVGIYEREGYSPQIGDRLAASPGSSGILFAQPFYFNVDSAGDLSFLWEFGEELVDEGAEPSIFSFSIAAESLLGIEQTLALTVSRPGATLPEQAHAATTLKISP